LNRLIKERVVGNLKIASILIILIFLIFSIIFKGGVKSRLEEDAVNDLKKDAVIIANEIDIYFTKYAEIVSQMLNSKVIMDYIILSEKDPNGKYNDSYDDALDKLIKIKSEDKNLALVWLGLNKINDVITNNKLWKPFENFDISNRSWYKEMLENGKGLTFSKPYYDAGTGNIVVSIVAPIYNDEELIGNVGIDININDLSDYVDSYKIGDDGYALLLNDEKEYIVHNDKNITLSKYLIDQIISGENEVIKYNLDGDMMYFAYAPVRINNWTVGSIVPQIQVMKFANYFNAMAWGIILLMAIMIFVFEIIIRLSSDYVELNNLYGRLQERELALEKSNKEITLAYQQLSISDEELKAQYDEIQEYSSKIEELKLKYDLAIELTNSSVWEINLEDETAEISHGYFSNLNNEKHDMWSIFNRFLKDKDQERLKKSLNDYREGNSDEVYCQLEINDCYGEEKWILLQGRTDILRGDNRTKLSGVIIDITKIKEQETKIEELANIDPLTGIPNRRKFMKILSESIEDGRKGSIILLDIDNFKEINDTMGHVYGDTVLNIVAKRLLEISDENIVVSRFGGDEFLIELKDVYGEEEIKEYLLRIANAFSKKIVVGTETIYLSMSMGVTLYPIDSDEVTDLIMNADLAMYTVKETGKNNYAFYSNDMKTKIREKARIERRLRRAIEKNGFKLVYQPQISASDGEVCGYEALLRLKDGSISPGEFIPVAEETGLIIDIGRWVTYEVVRQLSIWKSEGMDMKTVAINFSAKQLNDEDYVEYLSDVLNRYEIDSKLIEIEITETILLGEKFETIETLNKIKELGISLALDDFGKGYSSINYLTYLPLNKIKLDKSLSDKFLYEDIDVINNIISLAHSLGFIVVAEGVETKEQFIKICSTNCNIIQGFYLSKPIENYEVIDINDGVHDLCSKKNKF